MSFSRSLGQTLDDTSRASLANRGVAQGERDTYNGSMNSSIIGGRDNFNQLINFHNHGLGPGFDKFCTFVATNAMHDSVEVSEQPKCHPGTRVVILEHLNTLAGRLPYEYPVVWLHGPAGAGKSAIEGTIAQLLSKRGLLLASFFFFRSSSGRNNARRFIATIAYQVALAIPATRTFVLKAFQEDPIIFSKSLRHQVKALVISPINFVCTKPTFDIERCPRIFVIDGLDECLKVEEQIEILRVLHDMVQELCISFTVFLASRPEHHIRLMLDGELGAYASQISLGDSSDSDADIEKYLVASFDVIRKTHPMRAFLSSTPWPAEKDIQHLISKASGQFIYASTVVRFVEFPEGNPVRRLQSIIMGGTDERKQPFRQLDSLYTIIFQTVHEDNIEVTLRILGCLLLDHPKLDITSVRVTERLLALEQGDVERLFFRLASLVKIDEYGSIKFFHASLSDYLFNSSRSGPFWIDPHLIVAYLLQRLFQLTASGAYMYWSHPDIRAVTLLLRHCNALFSNAAISDGLQQAIENWGIEEPIYDATYSMDRALYFFRDICPAILDGALMSPFAEMKTLFTEKRRRFEAVVDMRLSEYLGMSIEIDSYIFSLIFKDPDACGTWPNRAWTQQDRSYDRRCLRLLPEDTYISWRLPAVISFVRRYLLGSGANKIISEGRYAELALNVIEYWQRTSKMFPPGEEESAVLALFLARASFRQDLLQAIISIEQSILKAGVTEEFNFARQAYIEQFKSKGLYGAQIVSPRALQTRKGSYQWT